MSQTTKIVLGIVVVAVILAGAYYYWNMHTSTAGIGTTSAAAGDVTTLPSGSSATDASIAQDLSSIDSQITAVNADTASAGASVAAAQ
ncbi:MAG: hypothetical protein JWO84_269 [Parcubacteria group bacterium]|nr:hypothetical protein [Parcubacteria group bacterium]